MRLGFTVHVDGEPIDGVTNELAIVETERRFNLGVVSVMIGADPRLEALYWLMWRSLHPNVDADDDTHFLSFVGSFTAAPEVDQDDLPPPPPGSADGGTS